MSEHKGQQTKPHSPWYDRAMAAEARVRALEAEVLAFQQENHRLLGQEVERRAEVARLREALEKAHGMLNMWASGVIHVCDDTCFISKLLASRDAAGGQG